MEASVKSKMAAADLGSTNEKNEASGAAVKRRQVGIGLIGCCGMVGRGAGNGDG